MVGREAIKFVLLGCFVFIIFSLLFNVVLAQTGVICEATSGICYYVNVTGGSDLNNGSIDYPFSTIQAGIDVLGPGDYLYLRGGVHFLTSPVLVVNNHSGTSLNPITVKSYPGEWAIVDGTNVGAWEIFAIGYLASQTPSVEYWIFDGFEVRNLNYSNGVDNIVGDGGFVTNRAQHNVFRNLHLHDFYGEDNTAGIYLGSQSHYNRIENNVFGNITGPPKHWTNRAGILTTSSGYIDVINNTFFPKGTGIHFKHASQPEHVPGYGQLVENNTFVGVDEGIRFMGDNSIVRGNKFLGNGTNAGIFFSGNCAGICHAKNNTVIYNTFYNYKNTIFIDDAADPSSTSKNKLSNNIVYTLSRVLDIVPDQISPYSDSFTTDNNCYFSSNINIYRIEFTTYDFPTFKTTFPTNDSNSFYFQRDLSVISLNPSSKDFLRLDASETNCADKGAYAFRNFSSPFCGDGLCNNEETCSTCSQDCGDCSNPSESSGGGSSGGGGGGGGGSNKKNTPNFPLGSPPNIYYSEEIPLSNESSGGICNIGECKVNERLYCDSKGFWKSEDYCNYCLKEDIGYCEDVLFGQYDSKHFSLFYFFSGLVFILIVGVIFHYVHQIYNYRKYLGIFKEI